MVGDTSSYSTFVKYLFLKEGVVVLRKFVDDEEGCYEGEGGGVGCNTEGQ